MVLQFRSHFPFRILSSILDHFHHRTLLRARWLFLVIALSDLSVRRNGVWAERNVTVDDQDPSIVYSPAGAWALSANNSLDFGFAHMLTQNATATAVFQFTGTAIYFFSPLWPYTVNTAISLDGGPSTLVDLVDHSHNDTGQGPETVQSRVVWNATDLNFTQHVLNISVGVGQPFAVVDGLIYTDPNATTTTAMPLPSASSASPTTSSSASSSSTERVVASSTTNPTSSLSTSSSSKHIIPVALGTILGILGVFLLMIGMWFFFRRRRRPVSEAWTFGSGSNANGGPPPNANGYRNAGQPFTQGHAHGYLMEQTSQGTWQNSRYGFIGMPPPAIPFASPPPGAYHDPSSPQSRAPNRYQPGYTLSTITEKSTPKMADGTRTPLAAHSPASGQSEIGYYTPPPAGSQALGQGQGQGSDSASMLSAGRAGIGIGYYTPPPAAPSEVSSAGRAGVGAGGGYAVAGGGAEQQQQYHYGNAEPNAYGTGHAERSGYSGSSSSSTAVASPSASTSGHGEKHKPKSKSKAKSRKATDVNSSTGAGQKGGSSSSYWI
ncbi:hypothetical protein GALMADRAFT_133773 [Galerina marginata CBS 339.88]|uniref:Mid2 domain-containing protein n=1 Tax=Galerina marginata (strain CBS 339.88) TaxID=685588 RepID=A0A067TZK5_GALM3|nr:hypothetical protein GALMADRAFT_133773 [Galerina marginata CBS 339.88]